MSEQDSITMLRNDYSRLVTTVTSQIIGLEARLGMLEKLIIEIQTDREVRKERDRNLHDRLTRIEVSIKDVKDGNDEGRKQVVNLAKYILGALFTVILASVWAFVKSGGLNVAGS